MKKSAVEYYIGDDGQWYYRIKSANGQVLASGEGHTRRYWAKQSYESLKVAMKNPKIVILD